MRPLIPSVRRFAAFLAVLAMATAGIAVAQDGGPLTWTLLPTGGPETVFRDCRQIGSGNEVLEAPPGQFIPGRLSYLDLQCSREFTADMSLWTWRNLVVTGEVSDARRSGCLVLTNATNEIVAQWVYESTWPVSLSYDFISAYADETLELAIESLERVDGVPTVTNDDEYETPLDTPLTVNAPGVLANDIGGACGLLTAAIETPPALGTVNLATDGSFVYTPDPGTAEIVTFVYRACAGPDCDLAEVHIGVGVPVPVTLQKFTID